MINRLEGVILISTRVTTISLKDLVYQGVIDQICTGKLTSDDVITEKQLIETFGVSKSPVREALIQLCAENVLKSMPRYGYQVIQVSQKNIHDLTELRLYLELSSLAKAMENMDEEKFAFFRRLSEKHQIDPVTKTAWTSWNNNCEFHLHLLECAGNAQITSVVEKALATCRRAYAQAYIIQRDQISPINTTVSQHDIIISSLERRDLFTAHEALKKDIQQFEIGLLGIQ